MHHAVQTTAETTRAAHMRSTPSQGDVQHRQVLAGTAGLGNQAMLRRKPLVAGATTRGGDRQPRPSRTEPLLQRKCSACGGDEETLRAKPVAPSITASPFGVPQAKLTIGSVDDPLEHEADRTADAVMRMPNQATAEPDVAADPGGTTNLRRACAACGQEADEPVIRRSETSVAGHDGGSDAPPIVNQTLSSPGQQLDAATRAFFEPRFGRDLGAVRVHTDGSAGASAASVGARAYTVGTRIAFGTGQYAPHSAAGRHLLAHELAHVAQQNATNAVLPLRRKGMPALSAGDATTLRRQTEADEDTAATTAPVVGQATGQGAGADDTLGGDGNPCPPTPTGIGDIEPNPSCPQVNFAGTNELARLFFCADSDQLLPSEHTSALDAIIRPQPRSTRFLVHGHSSIDGDPAYNFRLAGLRANNIADAIRRRLAAKLLRQNLSQRRIEPEVNIRAEVNARVETGSRGGTKEFSDDAASNRVVVIYGQIPRGVPQQEPSCEEAPRHIGDITPEVPCDLPTMDLSASDGSPQLQHFHFCLDSDVLSDVGPTNIAQFAFGQAADAQFIVHGFASIEGKADANQRLSCHRALRVARELINAGVRPEQIIEVSGIGATDTIPGGPEFNRVAIVFAAGGRISDLQDAPLPATTQQQKDAIVAAARARLSAGQYRLEADSYISFWTCGRTATVREAVERLIVLTQDANGKPAIDADGKEENVAVNTVRISDATLRADNPIECTMGRLVDMGFHHAVIGDPDLDISEDLTEAANKKSRHDAGLHLAALAGFTACLGRTGQRISSPESDDPRKKKESDDPLKRKKELPPPKCAQAPQPTRLLPPEQGAKGREAPTFKVTSPVNGPNFVPGTGRFTTNFDPNSTENSKVRLITKPDKDILTASANVQLSGKPEVFGDYEVGFIQAILGDETQVDYDSGHRVTQGLSTPIRLAETRDSPLVPTPWTTLNAMQRPDASGAVSLTATGSRLNTEAAVGLQQLKVTLPKAAITGFERGTRIAIWLVARRLGAPLDRFSLHFIDGATYDLVQICHLEHARVRGFLQRDAVTTDEEVPIFTGGFHAAKPSLLPEDPALARFDQPVAGEISWFNQVKAILEAEAATEAGKNLPELTSAVADILDNLLLFDSKDDVRSPAAGTKTPRLGFDYIPLKITLPMVRTTGRLENPDQPAIVVKVDGPGLGGGAAHELARALEFRIRDRTFQGKDDVVVRPSIISGSEAIGNVIVSLPALQEPSNTPQDKEASLIKRADVLDNMAEAMACMRLTATPEFINVGVREFGRAYLMNRDKTFSAEPSDRLAAGKEEADGVHELLVPCPAPFEGAALGDFHTHPVPEAVPEIDDADQNRARHCGAQHFIVSESGVFRYFPDKSVQKINVSLPNTQCHAVNLEFIKVEK